MNNKSKNKRYRRGNVADEVPSTILLDNDDDEDGDEIEEEEPGEISDEINEHKQKTSFQPFDYDNQILSASKWRQKSVVINVCLFFIGEKFKKPADDEDIYEPNRPTKSTKAKVNDITHSFLSSQYFLII